MDEGDEKGSRRLTQQQVEQVMHGAQKPLAPCLVQARRRDPDMLQATVEVVVDGQGRVLASRVNSKRYSPLSRCVHGMLRRIRFPRSDVRRTVASFTLGIPD